MNLICLLQKHVQHIALHIKMRDLMTYILGICNIIVIFVASSYVLSYYDLPEAVSQQSEPNYVDAIIIFLGCAYDLFSRIATLARSVDFKTAHVNNVFSPSGCE